MKPSSTPKTVRYTLDPTEPLTDDQAAELKALHNRPIDYSDIPAQGSQGDWYSPGAYAEVLNKQQVTLRIDADVLEFFRASGKRYQTRINNVLRDYMNAHRAKR
jgi:uncharacterized protein (DUF4415 family)